MAERRTSLKVTMIQTLVSISSHYLVPSNSNTISHINYIPYSRGWYPNISCTLIFVLSQSESQKVKSQVSICTVYTTIGTFSDGCINIILQKFTRNWTRESSVIFGKSQESRPIFQVWPLWPRMKIRVQRTLECHPLAYSRHLYLEQPRLWR